VYSSAAGIDGGTCHLSPSGAVVVVWSAAIYRRFCFSFFPFLECGDSSPLLFLFLLFLIRISAPPSLCLCVCQASKTKTKAAMNRRTPKEDKNKTKKQKR
jgi:hypothetical protein